MDLNTTGDLTSFFPVDLMEVKKIVKFGPGGFYSKSQLISSNEGIQ